MSTILAIAAANVTSSLVSVLGLIGITALSKEKISQYVFVLVALSAGTMLGGAFLHLLPEATEELEGLTPFAVTLVSFIGFFLLEKMIHYRHCHTEGCDEHKSTGVINLVGDAVHNFIDGVIIAGAFMTDMRLGVVTTVAVLLHEIPQEVGDLGVLLHAGFSKRQAIWSNLAISFTALLGGVFGYIFAAAAESVTAFLLPVAAGSFLYLASSDLLPEIRKEDHTGRFSVALVFVCLGIAIMAVFTLFE